MLPYSTRNTRNSYITSLQSLHASGTSLAQSNGAPFEVPVELLKYIDDGGNPDNFIVDVVRSASVANEAAKGKVDAFRYVISRLHGYSATTHLFYNHNANTFIFMQNTYTRHRRRYPKSLSRDFKSLYTNTTTTTATVANVDYYPNTRSS